MEKANVIKALKLCAAGNCDGCSYYGIINCTSKMSDDAAALLKASEAPKANTPKYTRVEVYTKKGNLLDYFQNSKADSCKSTEEYNKMREYYAREREIQLLCMFRWEKGKVFCKIKCPVNPMPTNAEFEAVSPAAVFRFLNANGWTFKQEFYPRMFE